MIVGARLLQSLYLLVVSGAGKRRVPQDFMRKESLLSNPVKLCGLNGEWTLLLFAVTASVILWAATNISLSNFLLDLKPAFSKLAYIRVHELLCFLYFSQVSNAF